MLGTMSVEYEEGDEFLIMKDVPDSLPTDIAISMLLEFGSCDVKSERVLKVWFNSEADAKKFVNDFGREISLQKVFGTIEEGKFQRNETEESNVFRSDRFVGGEFFPPQYESTHPNSSNQQVEQQNNNTNYHRRDRLYDGEVQNVGYRKTGDQNYLYNVSGQPMFNRQRDFRPEPTVPNQNTPSYHGNYQQPVNSQYRNQPQPPMNQPYFEHSHEQPVYSQNQNFPNPYYQPRPTMNEPYYELANDQYIPNYRLQPSLTSQSNDPRQVYNENNLYVYNLPRDVEEWKLREMFREFGKIVNVRVERNPGTYGWSTSKGYGFVEFENHQDADKARACMNGAKVGEKNIVVRFNKLKRRRDFNENNLFVFHLPQFVDNKKLREMFSEFGKIVSVKVIKKPSSTKTVGLDNSKGYGFVMFERYEDAQRAKECMNGVRVGEKFIVVRFKKKEYHSENSSFE